MSNYKPFPVGTVRGPYHSSPGNPLKFQACVQTSKGWVYFFSKVSLNDALKQAQAYAKTLPKGEPLI